MEVARGYGEVGNAELVFNGYRFLVQEEEKFLEMMVMIIAE